ncbi:MAG: lipid-A-disaccharide synthase [Cytophagales bacterium]|jgi:lipid-A-disaccharide synthase|nr:lipid-A-disaccharide synthase [Cytophagales bacterium]
MKYYFIAGERSGDLHAANLMKALRQEDPKAEFRAWGGDDMQAAGAQLVKHYREMAFMGFWEVFKNLRTIRGFLKHCQQDILAWQPNVVVLVDYAGFNLRVAAFCKQHGIRTYYYISPKVWAWNQRRALKIKAVVDRMFVILPFEQDFFRQFDYEVDYVGNPLLDAIHAFRPDPTLRTQIQPDDRPVIALLPGSRRQEVEKMLPVMLAAARLLEAAQPGRFRFVVAGVSNLPPALYQSVAGSGLSAAVFYDQSYEILACATAAWVTSGTATLETALFNVPQVVCYRTSGFTYQIAKRLIKVKYISLVNLVADAPVVSELIQDVLTPETASAEISRLLPGQPGRAAQLTGYARIQERMGQPGASARTARLMVSYLQE